jgi:hypothetical protein
MFGAPCSTDDEDDDAIDITRECFNVELVDGHNEEVDDEDDDEGDLDRPPRRAPRPAASAPVHPVAAPPQAGQEAQLRDLEARIREETERLQQLEQNIRREQARRTTTRGLLTKKKPTYRQGGWAHSTAQVSMWQPPQCSCGKCPNLPPQREEEFKKG